MAVLASGMVSETWNWIPWVIAGMAIVVATSARREREFHLSPSHFVERHGLVVLIALGESVVATGAVATDIAVGRWLVAWVVIGVALAAALWWSYFDGDDEARSTRCDRRASGRTAHRLAIQAYYYAHLHDRRNRHGGGRSARGGWTSRPAGTRERVADLRGRCGVSRWCGRFRWLLHIGPAWQRFAAGALALGAMPVGEWSGSFPQLALVVLVLVGMLAVGAFGSSLCPVTSTARYTVRP